MQDDTWEYDEIEGFAENAEGFYRRRQMLHGQTTIDRARSFWKEVAAAYEGYNGVRLEGRLKASAIERLANEMVEGDDEGEGNPG
jgi:hypothetical protein